MKSNKPSLSFWQIWNMNFGFLGIQFGFALQNANTSRIFETLGAEASNLAVYWLAAPMTGLIVQPIIGYYSDKTWHPKWGRRRPYFAIGAILASIALVLMPNSSVIWMAVGTLWIMDASINISMEPFRAFVGDMLPPSQRTGGFAMQTFFIGLGAVIASALPWILSNWFSIANTAEKGVISPSVRYSFYIGAAIFAFAVFWTVFTTKEYPPEEFESDETNNFEDDININDNNRLARRFLIIGLLLLVIGVPFSFLVWNQSWDKELYILGGGIGAFGLAHVLSSLFIRMKLSKTGLVNIVKDFNKMPNTMIQLAFVQFFSWLALFAMWIYTTTAVTQHIYGTTDTTSQLYNEGANWVGIMFATYNGLSALFAFLFPPFAKATSRKTAHMVGLTAGGLGLISMYFMPTPEMLLISMAGVGFAWASILTMPYAILAGALPANKMGIYMGIFNFFIVIPQIVAASILGILLSRVFAGEAIYIIVVGGVSMILAALLMVFVKDK